MGNFDSGGADNDIEVRQLNVPPHSVEAEQSLLGGLLLENTALDVVADVVVENDFYRLEHRLVFRAICQLVHDGKPADIVTVQEELALHDELESAGGF